MANPPLYLDRTWSSPAENLAADEALLEFCGGAPATQVLRFWESPSRFVVLGHSNPAATEVDLAACEALGLPVLRRCSGGGTVVQGPGCLNYALVLRLDAYPQLASVPSTNRFIMETHRAVLATLTGEPVEVRGITDLAIRGRKFSGNAQKRGRTLLLFHGTLLLEFDLVWVSRGLRLPSRAPAYRGGRSHEDFLMNLRLEADQVKQALRQAWGAVQDWAGDLEPLIRRLMRERYEQAAWHRKF